MRRSSILFNLLGAVGLVGLLIGCGSGGGGATTGTGGAASGSSAASGTITGFGSVYVNGKKFETNDVQVNHDGESERCSLNPSNRCGLKEGMTVKVSGSFNGSSRSASTITQEDTLEGPITSKNQVDANNGTLAVLGQTVIVDSTTRFDSGINLTTLSNGNVIEVSGFVKSDGTIVASFIEQKAGVGVCSPVCEVKGTIKGHDAVLATFQIGGLTVTYDNNTIIGDMPTPVESNWNGRFVEVKGTDFSVNAGVPTLVATKVESENDGVGNNDMDEFEVEGFVTQAGTPNGKIIDFTIGTTQIRTTANTEFRGGTIDEIVVGAKLSAEGWLANGILTAKHVKFHASVKLEGNIATINGNAFTIDGLPGVAVTVNSQTEGGNALNSLLGSHVRVRGRVSGSSSVIATRVEQRSADTDVDLQGPVQSVVGQDLTILGVVVDTSTISNDNFEGLNDQIIGRVAFFNVVKEGTLVKVKGRLNSSIVTWREAELED
jgi:hypothetical protein